MNHLQLQIAGSKCAYHILCSTALSLWSTYLKNLANKSSWQDTTWVNDEITFSLFKWSFKDWLMRFKQTSQKKTHCCFVSKVTVKVKKVARCTTENLRLKRFFQKKNFYHIVCVLVQMPARPSGLASSSVDSLSSSA